MNGKPDFLVAHDLDLGSVKAVQSAFLETIGTQGDQTFYIEISSEDATQIALQVVISGISELQSRGLPYETGPIASSVLKRCVSDALR